MQLHAQFFTLLKHFSLKHHGNAYYAYCSIGQRLVGSLDSKLEARSSMISRIEFRGTVKLVLTGTVHFFENVKPNGDRELSIFKSILFISLIKFPIVNPFNYKLLTTLSCPFFVIVRAVAGADWSAKLIKENDTDESRFSKQTSTAHGDNFGGIYD